MLFGLPYCCNRAVETPSWALFSREMRSHRHDVGNDLRIARVYLETLIVSMIRVGLSLRLAQAMPIRRLAWGRAILRRAT